MWMWLEKIFPKIKEKKGRRGIENLVIFFIVGVIIIIVSSSFKSPKETKDVRQNMTNNNLSFTERSIDELDELESRLEKLLSHIEGAGQVSVMITRISDGEVVHAFNQSEETRAVEERKDGELSTKIDESKFDYQMVLTDSGIGGKTPVVIKKTEPILRGVVVVADGAGNPVVKQNITQAVEALLELPVHRIKVLKRK